MSRHIVLVVAIFSLSASGCVGFQHPLSPPEKADYDASVYGTWYHQKTTESGKTSLTFLHIGEAGRPSPKDGDRNFSPEDQQEGDSHTQLPFEKLTRVVFTEHKPNGEVESSCWLAYPTHIGKLKYANVPVIEDGKIFTYFYWKYDLDGDRLSVWTNVDKDAVDKMVAEGKLHQDPDSHAITETTEELQKLLTNGGDAILFPDDKKAVFRRWKLPE